MIVFFIVSVLFFFSLDEDINQQQDVIVEQIAFNYLTDSIIPHERIFKEAKFFFSGKTEGRKTSFVLTGHCLNYYNILDKTRNSRYSDFSEKADSLSLINFKQLPIVKRSPVKNKRLLCFNRKMGERDYLMKVYNSIVFDSTLFVEIIIAHSTNSRFIHYLVSIDSESNDVIDCCRWSISY